MPFLMSLRTRLAFTSTRSSASASPSRRCSPAKPWTWRSSSSSTPSLMTITSSPPLKRSPSLILFTLQTTREADHGWNCQESRLSHGRTEPVAVCHVGRGVFTGPGHHFLDAPVDALDVFHRADRGAVHHVCVVERRHQGSQ